MIAKDGKGPEFASRVQDLPELRNGVEFRDKVTGKEGEVWFCLFGRVKNLVIVLCR
jgi:hypothetical protein